MYMQEQKDLQNLQNILGKKYTDDIQLQNNAFIKLGGKICSKLDQFGEFFLHLLQSSDSDMRRNMLHFLKLMTSMEYLMFSSTFIDELFRKLVKMAMNSSGEEMDLACLMFVNRQMLNKYLGYLAQNLYVEEDDRPNFSLRIFERLLYNIINIQQGNIKGPTVKAQHLGEVFTKSYEFILNLSTRKYRREDDKITFFSICRHVIGLKRLFNPGIYQLFPLLHTIWQQQILSIDGSQSEHLINEVFRFMNQIFTINDYSYFKQANSDFVFTKLQQLSTEYALKCGMINKFWNNLIKKLSKVNDLTSFNTFPINLSLCICLIKATNSMEEICEKLAIIQNITLLNSIKSQMHDYKRIKENLLQYYNPQIRQLDRLYFVALQALHCNLFQLHKYKELQDALNGLIIFSSQDNSVDQIFLNQLPAFNILILKSPAILETPEALQNLISFLFKVMGMQNMEGQHHLQNFIDLICRNIQRHDKKNQFQKDIGTRIKNIITSCQLYLLAHCKNSNIDCQIKCLQKLTTLVYDNKLKLGIFNNYLDLIKARQKYEECLYQATKEIIKKFELDQNFVQTCLMKLQHVIQFDTKKYSYVELILDFFQANKRHRVLLKKMNQFAQLIDKTSGNCYDIHQILKGLNCRVMMLQNNKTIQKCEDIYRNLKSIVQQRRFDAQVYKKIIPIMQKFKGVLNHRDFQRQGHVLILAKDIIGMQIKMLDLIQLTLDQNQDAKNSQKAIIYFNICKEIYNFAVLIVNHSNFLQMKKKIDYYQLVEKIKTRFNESHKFHFKPIYYDIQKTMKTAYLMIEFFDKASTQSVLGLRMPVSEYKQMSSLVQITEKSSKKSVKSLGERDMDQNLGNLAFYKYYFVDFDQN